MFPSPTAHRLFSMASLATLALAFSACSTGAKLRVQAEELQVLTESIEDRAYRCAPRQLATAQAHTEFGLLELDQGDFTRARYHIELAEQNARDARILSRFDECLLQERTIDTAVARAAEVKAAPVDFLWDSDVDGIPDHLDQCPYEPIVFMGDPKQAETGCPNYDIDGDGLPNIQDHCPSIPGNVDGTPGVNGCPMLDLDGDGILNINDSCAYDPVEYIGYQDETGCPVEDIDGDGVPNVLDECPFEPGPASNAGCPVEEEPEEKLAEVVGDRIQLNQKVFFETAKATILPVSYPLLNQVAQILMDHPNITIRIEGHTDSRGSWQYNKTLSQNRAASVRQFLIDRGIDPLRMDSEGYSYDRPIDDNATEEGRANNRRVEIHITSQ